MGAGLQSSWRARRARLTAALEGAVTILAFTESGRMRRLRLPKRVLAIFTLTFVILVAGSTISILNLFRGQVDLARIAYLERENRSLASLLQGQAEHLSRLRLEVERLKSSSRTSAWFPGWTPRRRRWWAPARGGEPGRSCPRNGRGSRRGLQPAGRLTIAGADSRRRDVPGHCRRPRG